MSTPNEPSVEDLRGAPVLPGFELPDSVTLGRGVVHGAGIQPEDIGVLAWLKLRDPRKPATQEDLAKEMQAAGWKMGKSRFAGIFQRLKAAGHIKHHSAYNPDTGRPEWRIEFFMNPANNDEYVNSGISAFPQVGAEFLETRDSQKEQLFETPETSVSRGQKESQVSRDSEGNPGNRGFPQAGVPAGHGRNSENRVSGSPPPHPPEEVTTSSPYPLTRGTDELPSQRGEGEESFAPKDIHAAESFLQKLKPPHHMGAVSAKKYAPQLLRSMAQQGWPSIYDVDHSLLEREVTRDPDGLRRKSSLVPIRIKDLPRYDVVATAGKPQDGPTRSHGVPQRLDPSQLSKRSVASILDSLVKDV